MTWSVLMLDNQGIFVIFVVLGWSLVIVVVEQSLGLFFQTIHFVIFGLAHLPNTLLMETKGKIGTYHTGPMCILIV